MKRYIRLFLFVVILLTFTTRLSAQMSYFAVNDSIKEAFEKDINQTPIYERKQLEISESEVIKFLDSQPSFAVHKDVFFTTGIPLNTSINRNTADAMFQISIRQRLTKSYLPFNTFAFLTYSQKSFWDIYAESAPFKDNNYNPGIGLGRYIVRDNKLQGAGFVQIEHESNGKDGEDSRSWNYLSFSSKYFFNLRLALGIKLWVPFVDGGENKDLLDYRGLGTLSVNYISKESKWWVSGEITPRKGFGNANTMVGIAYRVSERQNQYLFARFYNGKGDSLIDYNKYDMNLRIGICIKPDFYSVY